MATAKGKGKKRRQRNLAAEITGIIGIALAVLLGLAIYAVGSGVLVEATQYFFLGSFGFVAYLLPVALFAVGVYVLLYADRKFPVGKAICWSIMALCVIGCFHLGYASRINGNTFDLCHRMSFSLGVDYRAGAGALGNLITYPLRSLLGAFGSFIVLLAGAIICVLVGTSFSIRDLKVRADERRDSRRNAIAEQRELRERTYNHQRIERQGSGATQGGLKIITVDPRKRTMEAEYPSDIELFPNLPNQKDFSAARRDGMATDPLPLHDDVDEPMDLPWESEIEPDEPAVSDKLSKADIEQEQATIEKAARTSQKRPAPYRIPPLSMLPKASSLSARELRSAQVETNTRAALLERTFENFGISARVVNTSVGPSVTQFEVQPSAGVRVKRIVDLSNDIALSMAASGVRIEAPIPGKNAIGIEVPNKDRKPVMLREIMEGDNFKNSKSMLAVVLGKDIAGEDVVIDLARMPHLLIGGTTGSGKSVCVNSMIASILFRATPEEVKIIMIDPKVVEFTSYNGIPHLMVPVVTDVKKAAGALQWGVAEMLRRYNSFAERGAKEIRRYNDIMKMSEQPQLPYVVIFIDELADLMMAAPKEVEDALCRIAQMGRAAGIHLVVATQSPRANVVTGLIKANFPSRIGLTVSSALESQIILNQSGAEKLCGYGDMLFMSPSTPKPVRIQGPLITDPEVEAVTDFLKAQVVEATYDNEVIEQIEQAAAEKEKMPEKAAAQAEGEEEGDLLYSAIELFLDAGQGSTSLLQRRLRVGYGRAARLLDTMEEMGIIGPPDGPRPRKVLISREQFAQMRAGGSHGA